MVAVEALRNEDGLQHQEGQHPGQEQARDPDQVPPVPEEIAHQPTSAPDRPAADTPSPPGANRNAGQLEGLESAVMIEKNATMRQEPNGS
jgi:hypothetical protein